jgi:hypothetical protein
MQAGGYHLAAMSGRIGGLFRNREAALRFIRQQIISSVKVIEERHLVPRG